MEDILIRLFLADCGIGAELIAENVADFIASGIGLGPLFCVGHVGEKWSFIFEQQGHMNQCDEVVVFVEGVWDIMFDELAGDCFVWLRAEPWMILVLPRVMLVVGEK